MVLAHIAQGAPGSDEVAWHEWQITGVLAGAGIAALVALVVASMSRRQARVTRWDDARRQIYTAFLAADLELYEADTASSDARLRWVRATATPDETEAASKDIAASERLKAAKRAMKTRTAEVLIFGGGPVREAATTLVACTTKAGRAYFEKERSYDRTDLQAQTAALTATYESADSDRDTATDTFLSRVREELKTE